MSGPKIRALNTVIILLFCLLPISFCFRPRDCPSLKFNPSGVWPLRRQCNTGQCYQGSKYSLLSIFFREAFVSHLAVAAADGGAWDDALKEYAKATKLAPKKSRHKSLAVEPPAAWIDVHREATDFFGSMKIPFVISSLDKTRVRSRSKLAVQPLSRWGGIKLGLYRPQSHDVEERLGGYAEHYVEIDQAAAVIKAAALSAGVRGYQRSAPESAGKGSRGFFRYVQISVERASKKVQLVIVWNAPDSKAAGEPLHRFIKELRRRSSMWHSISVNFNEADSNAIFDMSPASWKLFYGPPYAKENIGGISFCFPPQAFRQRAYRSVVSSTQRLSGRTRPAKEKGDKRQPKRPFSVLELYAGVGVLGVHAAAAILGEAQPEDDWQVVCVDSNPFVSNTVFRHGLASVPEAHRHKLRYLRATAEEALSDSLRLHEDCDVLVVNPPRRGLCEAVMKMLLSADQHAIRRVIYIGCGFDALRQNVRALVDSRRWRILAAEGFDLFPSYPYSQSDHMSRGMSTDGNSLRTAKAHSVGTVGALHTSIGHHSDVNGANDSRGSGGALGTMLAPGERGRSHIETLVVLDRLLAPPCSPSLR